ncbi:MAG: ferritin family protein [Halarsenatibacteraceae bacterium]
MQDIYEFALEFEKENRKFYEECASGTSDKTLKSVFKELASEEAKHEEIVQALADDRNVESVQSNINMRAKEAFDEIADKFNESDLMPEGQVEIYKKAKELEIKSKNFYKDHAEETDNKTIERVFNELSNEEKKHEEILENIITMVNRPNTWLDDAEWYHLEEY